MYGAIILFLKLVGGVLDKEAAIGMERKVWV